jgi:hypothetical protein
MLGMTPYKTRTKNKGNGKNNGNGSSGKNNGNGSSGKNKARYCKTRYGRAKTPAG